MKHQMRQELNLQQKLIISPLILQKLELLAVPLLELTEKLEKEVEANPVIELEYKDMDNETAKKDSEVSENEFNKFEDSSDPGMVKQVRHDKIIRDYNNKIYIENFASKNTNLNEYIMEQIHFLSFTDTDVKMAKLIISAIDDRGFIAVDLKQLIEKTDFDIEAIEIIRQKIMRLDPIGIASKNLVEYLSLQIEIKYTKNGLEYMIIHKYSDLIEKKRYSSIVSKINSNRRKRNKIHFEDIENAIENIKKLNFIPISSLSPGTIKYIIPDARVEVEDNKIHIELLDDYIPNIIINKKYEKWYSTKKKDDNTRLDKKTLKYLKENINKANILVENLQSRKEIIFKVILAIIERQKEYFIKGEQYQIPLKLKDIADELNIHESTVSRATKEKYIQTEKGIISLKSFFSTNVGNDTASSKSIKAILKQIIDAEDKNDPLTDERLVKVLRNKGISISRRTVAKYRNALRIDSASGRRNPH